MTDTEILAKNLTKFRKKCGLTQKELAEYLNYSDKTISKWERAEGHPDVFVLKEIAKLFGTSVDALLTDGNAVYQKNDATIKSVISGIKSKRHTTMLFIALGILLTATVLCYTFLSILYDGPFRSWLVFIYAIPLICVGVFVFVVCKTKRLSLVCMTIFLWSTLASIYLSLLDYPNMWFIFLIGIPVQVLAVVYCHYINLGYKKRLAQKKQQENEEKFESIENITDKEN